VKLVPFALLDRRQLQQVCNIYEDAFPPALRVEFGDLADPAAGGGLAWALLDEADVLGFCACLLLGETAITFLRYFAVAGRLRSRGLGRAMWTLLLRQIGALASEYMVFEVEDPSAAEPQSMERRTRERRIAFYQRCGATVLPVTSYRQPNLVDAAAEPEKMLLMSADIGLGTGRLEGPHKKHLREVVVVLYEHRYGLGIGHPLVQAAIVSL
jgi:GNAT superfamily N-acetyltransferase